MRVIYGLFLLAGCSIFFGTPDRPKSAKNSEYSIRFAGPGWAFKNDEKSADYVFENKDDGRILLSNSFCKEFQDLPLERLAQKTFNSIKNFKSKVSEYTTLENREAYRLEGTGEVDGVKVGLKLLNTRRNNCYFDFLAITPLKSAKPNDSSFNDFLKTVVFP